MKINLAKWIAGAAAVMALSVSTNVSGQIRVREFNLEGQQIGGHYGAYYLATNPADQAWAEDSGFFFVDDVEDFKEDVDYVNMGGNGWWNDDNGYPLDDAGFLLGDDYVIDARANVSIPAGTWTISFNTDDGGQLTLPGANFDSTFRTDDGFGKGGPDQFWFRGNRGHQATGATFTVPEGQTLDTVLHATMHERGGGDSFEITIRPGSGNIDPRADQNDWVLLENGAHGWSVSPTDDLPAMNSIGLPATSGAGGGAVNIAPGNATFALGNVTPGASAVITTSGDGTATSPGLNQRWYTGGNPGNLNGQLSRIVNDTPVAQFTNENTWWDGNNPDLAEFDAYPAEVDGAGGLTADANDNYMAWMSGEINLPAGETRFRMGVDDYKYLAIDSGGNGIAGDQPGEVLLDNNVWLNSAGARGNLDWTNVVSVNSENGGWTKIEIITAEGGGGDGAVLYWDEGNEDNFPFVAPFQDDGLFAPEDYAVPSDALRSVERGDVDGVVLKSTLDGATLDLEVSSRFRDSDRVTLRNADFETQLDLTGATVNVLALDDEELVEGDQWVIFDADQVLGLDAATLNLPGGAEAWDISGLVDGTSNRITYVGAGGGCDPNSLGDLNGDGSVGFPDFLVLSANFGNEVGSHTEGDINCDGSVGFPDFLILSANFGQTVGQAASVPEPSGVVLLSVAGLALGLVRRRR